MDLSLCTLDELLDELDKRADDYIFYGRRKICEDGEVYSYRRAWKGHIEATILMTRLMERKLLNDHEFREEDVKPWEEL